MWDKKRPRMKPWKNAVPVKDVTGHERAKSAKRESGPGARGTCPFSATLGDVAKPSF